VGGEGRGWGGSGCRGQVGLGWVGLGVLERSLPSRSMGRDDAFDTVSWPVLILRLLRVKRMVGIGGSEDGQTSRQVFEEESRSLDATGGRQIIWRLFARLKLLKRSATAFSHSNNEPGGSQQRAVRRQTRTAKSVCLECTTRSASSRYMLKETKRETSSQSHERRGRRLLHARNPTLSG
jgi:hypothetical protein